MLSLLIKNRNLILIGILLLVVASGIFKWNLMKGQVEEYKALSSKLTEDVNNLVRINKTVAEQSAKIIKEKEVMAGALATKEEAEKEVITKTITKIVKIKEEADDSCLDKPVPAGLLDSLHGFKTHTSDNS